MDPTNGRQTGVRNEVSDRPYQALGNTFLAVHLHSIFFAKKLTVKMAENHPLLHAIKTSINNRFFSSKKMEKNRPETCLNFSPLVHPLQPHFGSTTPIPPNTQIVNKLSNWHNK